MNTKKQVLQGIDNFKRLIDKNGYYIDKTELIKDLIDVENQTTLITRPRRFGKTLNMSMLKYFFEIPECRKYDLEDIDVGYLFEGLKIFDDDKYKAYQGKYPVVYLTFKNAKQDNWEETYTNIKYIISNEYKRYQYLLNKDLLSNKEKNDYIDIVELKAGDVEYTTALFNLTAYLKRYYQKDVIVLIDEYDTSIQAGYIYGYYDEVIKFFKSTLVAVFKDNKNLHQGVLTGIMKVAQESIFSDFNNPMVATILAEEFKERFGFTEKEVIEMAKYYDLEDKLEGIKNWYNGYIFGVDTVIYNPWSIIKYIYNPKNGFKPYWINTSDNRIIKETLHLNKKEGKETVEKLIKGEEVRLVLEENIVYQSIKVNHNSAWSFLLHAGYLKASDRRHDIYGEKFEYKLEIPNTEVRIIFRERVLEFFKDDEKISSEIELLISSLLDEDIGTFEIILQDLYLKFVSYNDVKVKEVKGSLSLTEEKNKHENFHHGFILGLLMYAINNYEVYSNKEFGLGRPDIVLIPKDTSKMAYVFEFKWDSTKGSKKIEELIDLAKKQVTEKKYIKGVKAVFKGDVKAICIGFKGKELLLEGC